MTSRVTINRAGLEAFERSGDVDALMGKLGEDIAQEARAAAPKDSGAGAESIDYETGVDEDGPYVRVSWDRSHFYMAFQELGTSRQPARPFLRPALERRRSI